MKAKFLASLAAAAASMAVAMPQAHAAEVTIAATNPVVELNIFEQVEVEPDIATIGAGVDTEALTAVEALRKNSADMQRVIDLIKALGIAPRDIQTTRVTLNARYDYDQARRRPVFLGYTASNQVSVKLRDIKRSGEVLDALVSAGANNVFGPNFSIEDDTAAKADARKRALARGQEQAQEYARAAGYAGVRLLQVAETIQTSPRTYDSSAIVVTASRVEASAPPPPIEPGLVGTGVNIRLTYEMVR